MSVPPRVAGMAVGSVSTSAGRVQRMQCGGQPGTGLGGDPLQVRVSGDAEHDVRINGFHPDAVVVHLADHDVAGQQQADRRFRLQRGMGQRRTAGAEDHLGCDVHVQFRLQRCLHVDLGEHPESGSRLRRGIRASRGHQESLTGCGPGFWAPTMALSRRPVWWWVWRR